MTFEELISPWTQTQFMSLFKKGDCFVIRGDADKFKNIITLQEIEARINDGCNWNHPLNIISPEGTRSAPVAKGIAWTNTALKKQEVLEKLSNGHSFMMTNLSQINPRVSALLNGIEDTLSEYSLHGDLHLYVSPRKGSTAYNAHRDYPQHKIYLQVIGKTDWVIFNHTEEVPATTHSYGKDELEGKLSESTRFVLEPGDLLYMPPAVFHSVSDVDGGRVSFSLPLAPIKGSPQMDRTYIPFEKLFQSV